jgi:hypothetical protein
VYRGFFSGVKLTTHFHLVPRSRIRGVILPLPQYVFMAWYLVKHRDKFTFTLPGLRTIEHTVNTGIREKLIEMKLEKEE